MYRDHGRCFIRCMRTRGFDRLGPCFEYRRSFEQARTTRKPNFSSNSHREAVCAQPLGSCDLPVVGPVLGSPSTLTVTDVTTGKTVLERLACRLPPTSGCRWQGA